MSGKKIKVALCLSGEPRSSMFCFPYIYESFINLGPKYEVETYIHSTKNFRAFELYNPVGYDWRSFSQKEYEDFLDQNIQIPLKLKESSIFYSNYTNQTDLVLNQIKMLEGINKSFNLIPSNIQPDIVIRCRFDFYTNYLIYIHNIIDDIIRGRYDIFVPSKIKMLFSKMDIDKEYSDQFAIGNYQSMFHYSNMINNLGFLLEDTQEWKAEHWVKSQLDYYKLKVNSYPIPLNLVRDVQIKSNKGFYSKDLWYLDQ